MKRDFFFVNDVENTIIYHVPTSRLVKVFDLLDEEQYTDEQLYDIFTTYEKKIEDLKKLEMSVGKPGIVFMAARTCNLGCKYCFAGEGEYGNLTEKPKFITCDLFMDTVKFLLEKYPEGIKSISFFGGEPLLDYFEIKKFIPKCIEYFNECGVDVPVFAFSTNLTLITDEMIEFIKEYHIEIVSSIDGPMEINDKARVFKVRKDSVYLSLKEATKKLRENGIKFALQMVINKNHINAYKQGQAIEWVKELEEWGYYDLAIVPVETDDPELEISGCEDLEKLDLIARELSNYYISKLFVDGEYTGSKGMIAPITQIATNKMKKNCTSGHSVFVDTDGNIYPCQMFCNDEEFLLGNIYKKELSKKKVEFAANINRLDSKICKYCVARKICSYWCKGIQRSSRGDVYEVCAARCVFQKAIMEESIKALVRLDKNTEEYKNFWKKIYYIYGIE